MPRLRIIPAAIGLVAVVLLGARWWNPAGPATLPATGPGEDPSLSNPGRSRVADGGEALGPAFELLRGKPSVDEVRRSLADLRTTLESLPREQAVAAVRGFLAGGDDRTTGLTFEIGRDGSLAEWPTFRTFLLDALLALDPTAAAAVGREILARPTSADEWALALRNVARGDATAGTSEFLRAKTEELIANPAWQAAPSIGYLNAFDVLVHVEATASTPLLSGLIQRKDRKDLAHAGFLTLDRLVQRQPADMLARLAADRDLHQSRPEMLAQQMARADLRDPSQQSLVKSWLLDPARSSTELSSFAGVYPNNNQFVSNNLLTAQAGPSGDDLAAHDREALKVIAAWSEDPGFLAIRDHLRAVISRLDGFVDVRSANPPHPPE